jgi:hypothetical protein
MNSKKSAPKKKTIAVLRHSDNVGEDKLKELAAAKKKLLSK